jgi:rubrerythrin
MIEKCTCPGLCNCVAREANRKRYEELLSRASKGGNWVAAQTICRVCGHEHVSVYPEGTEEDATECPNCGNMTCEPEEETS